tara:strand:+ start:463 stop:663 length:201 start_codon:yes stop_codon:yes gene_type:complete
MSDRDDSTDMVSPCCGSEYSEYTNYDEYVSADYICSECKEEFEVPIEDYEYAERKREEAAEFRRDE